MSNARWLLDFLQIAPLEVPIGLLRSGYAALSSMVAVRVILV